ncbi:DUF2197 domain-containing protein [Desulfosporosinus sp. PR]|uniref:DUF2197 domain-containing protein n=1 Tax=Candidatus Desulfosporosinus nitrosoreducens TaxID=3401928 RepID=UPI0027FCFBF0|nr:DUF2197 domain-containing protein [Desulfosporosinus sp. PR]MDQ7092934.1 DUF2197 domain-containing protein [Desulfosporosinus sp. PR]
MNIRCKLCGALGEIAPSHKDFLSVKQNPNFTYICEFCARKIQFEMQEANAIYKFNRYSNNPLKS